MALAQIEERLGGLRARFEQLETNLLRGRDEIDRVERHDDVLQTRRMESALAMLRAGEITAQNFSEKDLSERSIAELTACRIKIGSVEST